MPENPPIDDSRDQQRLEAVKCPFCDEVTMPNLMTDGSVICSCTAERGLPLDLVQGTPWDGMEGTMPMPADNQGFVGGQPEHRMPDGTEQSQGCSTLWNAEEVEEAIEAADGGAEAVLEE